MSEKAERELRQYGITVHQYVFNPNEAQSFIEKANQISDSNPDGIFLSPIFYRETLPFFENCAGACAGSLLTTVFFFCLANSGCFYCYENNRYA